MPVRFGEFEFDPVARELRARGRVTRLQEQPAQVLQRLVSQPGQVVTREELHQRLWPGKVYYDLDHGLNNAVARLREVLRDSAERPKYIETLPRIGYRFIAAVEESANPAHQGPPGAEVRAAVASPSPEAIQPLGPPADGRHPRRSLALLAACVIAGGSLLAWHFWHSATRIHSVVVLPFENLSADAGEDYFVEGVTDALITSLAKIDPLKVTSRTTAMHYKGLHPPVVQLRSELNVDAIVEGSVVRSGERVHLNVRLISTRDDRHRWAQSYDREVGSIIALENELAQAVAEAIAVELSPEERGRILHAHVPPAQAYDDYLHGKYLVNQVTPESELASIPYFESATSRDPQFAAAYAGLSQSYSLLGGESIALALRSEETIPKALAAARKAIALDAQLADGWMALGLALDLSRGARDVGAIRNAIERTLTLSPGDAWAHKRHADFLVEDGNDLPGALREYEASLRLDPLNYRTASRYGEALLAAGRSDEGFAVLRRTAQLNPWALVPHMHLGFACAERGRYEEAVIEFRKALQIAPDSLPAAVNLADAEGRAGYDEQVRALLPNIESLAQQLQRPSAMALIEVRLHHRDAALKWLRLALETHDQMFFSWDHDADWLASDPEYQRLERQAREVPAAQAIDTVAPNT